MAAASPCLVQGFQSRAMGGHCFMSPVVVRSSSRLYGPQSRQIVPSPPTINNYELLEPIGSGAFGIVFRAKDHATGKFVAIKIIERNTEHDGGLPSEIRHLSAASGHPSIVMLKEVFLYGPTSFIVMEQAKTDLRSLMQTLPSMIHEDNIRGTTFRLLQGIAHLHRLRIVHRDIKTPNILVTSEGDVKICDFGLACSYISPMLLPPSVVPVGTLPYIAPEMLLGMHYSPAIDMWSAGCVMAELVCKQMLFKGPKLVDVINQIFNTLGKPDERKWPEFYQFPKVKAMDIKGMLPDFKGLSEKIPQGKISSVGFNLLSRMLAINPRDRITAEEAISHPWFSG